MVSLLQTYLSEWKRQKKETVVVLSRYPVAGKAKTRLIPLLGETGAALSQRYMTEHLLDVISSLQSRQQDVRVQIQYYGGTDGDMRYWMDKRKNIKLLSWKQQRGDSLGDRIKHAFEDQFSAGEEIVLVVGGDIPGISAEILEEGLTSLRSGEKKMVIGRAEDGGYYLVGLQSKAKGLLDELFCEPGSIDWGTGKVFQQQCRAADKAGIHTQVLSVQLQDVDIPADIKVFEETVGVSQNTLISPKLTVIIPTLNEAEDIVPCLRRLLQQCSGTDVLGEIIIADGGSTDDTLVLVKQTQEETSIPIIVVNSPKGRGLQQQRGANAATGDILLFLHVDTKLPDNFHSALISCLNKPGNVAGAFPFGVYNTDSYQPSYLFRLQMGVVIFFARLRGRFMELPYGDQAIFLRRKTLEKIGGVPDTPLFEDFIMVERLQQIGHVAITDSEPTLTSARRWEKNGVIKTTGSNYLFVVAYKLGFHPDTLASWYYGRFKPVTKPLEK